MSESKYSIFTFEKPYSQIDGLYTSFPAPILRYILKKASADQWKKLQQICKLFFSQNPYIIIDVFNVADNRCQFAKHHFNFTTKNMLHFDKMKHDRLSNIWLSNTMIFQSDFIQLSPILPKISQCHVKDLRLLRSTISEVDLKLLTKWGKTERFFLIKVLVMNAENVQLPLEDVVQYAPYANDILIDSSITTPETSQKLAEIKRTRKFKRFRALNVNGELDHVLIYEFIKKNAGINSHLSIEFFADDEMTNIFNILLKHQLSSLNWESVLQPVKPSLTGYNPAKVYQNFGEVWNQLQVHVLENFQRSVKHGVSCECWTSEKCSSNLYKSVLQHAEGKARDQFPFAIYRSRKERIWYFFVKKSRPIRKMFHSLLS